MKLTFIALFLLFICTACSPTNISYPVFSAALESRSAEFNEYGIQSVHFATTMTGEGFGYKVESDVCPDVRPYPYRERFRFHAKRNDSKWTVTASSEIAEQLTKESALATLELMIDEVIRQCEEVSKIKTSWQK